jgi:RNA polymerase sigma-70 factor (ECF subfamily)
VVLVSDGGGLVTSARKPVLGADRVARFLLGVLAKEQPGDLIDRVVVNGRRGSLSTSKANSSRSSP